MDHDDTVVALLGMNMPRPFVFLNVAVTADGKTDTVARAGAGISTPADKARVDRLRAGADAVLVGGHTLLGDDPKLTVKSAELRAGRAARGLPENPAKVGVVSRAALKPDARFLTAGPARIFIFTTEQTSAAQLSLLRDRGVEAHVLGRARVDLARVFEILYEASLRRVMVEGGGTLTFELLRLGLIDELTVFVAPLIFGGGSAPTFVAGPGLGESEALKLELLSAEPWPDGGVLLHYKPLV